MIEKLVVKITLPCPVCQTVLKLSPEHPNCLPNNNYALHIIQLNAKLEASQLELVVINRRLVEANAELEREKAKRIGLGSTSCHPKLRRKLAVKQNLLQYNSMGNYQLQSSSSSQTYQRLPSNHPVWAYGENQQLLLHEPSKPPMQDRKSVV